MTGFIFFILAITILNYGTKLETSVSNSFQYIKFQKNNNMRLRMHQESLLQPQYQSENFNNSLDQELHQLDLRILTITIFLAIFFFVRSFIDSLFAWNIIQIESKNQAVTLLIIIGTEVVPSIAITLLLKQKKQEEKKETIYEKAGDSDRFFERSGNRFSRTGSSAPRNTRTQKVHSAALKQNFSDTID